MATRSIVAEVTPTGWRGRYCHWDGHPATKVDQLLLLVARDGVETVTRTLVQDHYSWSVIHHLRNGRCGEMGRGLWLGTQRHRRR